MAPNITTILFAPTNQYVEAQIVELSDGLIERRIHADWWNDPWLSDHVAAPPIDRHWNWNEMGIEIEGRALGNAKYAMVTGDQAVQGAMMISTEAVSSVLTPGAGALFLELLFTAPRNRPALRRDKAQYFVGVGTKLLAWGAALSQEYGCEGRLLLDGSPEFVGWYKKRGLQSLDQKPIVFENEIYTPMELPADAAMRLLADTK